MQLNIYISLLGKQIFTPLNKIKLNKEYITPWCGGHKGLNMAIHIFIFRFKKEVEKYFGACAIITKSFLVWKKL